MSIIISKILAVFTMGGVGFFAGKIRLFSVEHNKILIVLLMYIATPCMLISTISERELTAEMAKQTWITFFGTFLVFIITTLLAIVVVRLFRMEKKDAGVYISIMTLFNSGYLGIPVTGSVFGPDAMYLMAICNTVLCVWNFTATFIIIKIGTDDISLSGISSKVKSMLNPCMIASLAGLAMLFAGIHFHPWLLEIISSIGDMCVPLSMIVIGVQLSESKLGVILKHRDLVVSSLVKVAVFPLIALLAVNWLPIPDYSKLALVFCGCFPTAVGLVSVASLEDRNPTLASEGVALTTAFSIVTLSAFSVVLYQLYM